MSKSKMFGIGMAGLLSLLSVGCSPNKDVEKSEKAPTTENSVRNRRQNGREDISVSFIKREKDYVKSVNCLLTLHKEIIPMVRENMGQMDISSAMHQAFVRCRQNGLLKQNSVAYNFDDLVCRNYSGVDFEQWQKDFSKAGKEAEKILAEGDGVSRKFVPASISTPEFLRRNIENTNQDTWKTAADAEKEHRIYEHAKNWSREDRF